MRIVIIQSSPNRDGLTAACAVAAEAGTQEAGALVENVRLNDLDVALCAACGNGWGTCRDEHNCQVEDDFQALHAQVASADALIVVTPVYWGQPSESLKAFLDRFRRCEARKREASAMAGKSVLCVGAAGGSGGGTMFCLSELEHWIRHVRARGWDFIPITQRSRAYKLNAIRQAAKAMASAT